MAMTASAPGFDALATARKLKAAGVADAHAEAIAKAPAEAVAAAVCTARADRSELATKADLVGLEARFYRALLVLGAALAGFTVAVAGVAIGVMQALG